MSDDSITREEMARIAEMAEIAEAYTYPASDSDSDRQPMHRNGPDESMTRDDQMARMAEMINSHLAPDHQLLNAVEGDQSARDPIEEFVHGSNSEIVPEVANDPIQNFAMECMEMHRHSNASEIFNNEVVGEFELNDETSIRARAYKRQSQGVSTVERIVKKLSIDFPIGKIEYTRGPGVHMMWSDPPLDNTLFLHDLKDGKTISGNIPGYGEPGPWVYPYKLDEKFFKLYEHEGEVLAFIDPNLGYNKIQLAFDTVYLANVHKAFLEFLLAEIVKACEDRREDIREWKFTNAFITNFDPEFDLKQSEKEIEHLKRKLYDLQTTTRETLNDIEKQRIVYDGLCKNKKPSARVTANSVYINLSSIFDSVSIDTGSIVAETKPIIIKDYELGKYRIEISMQSCIIIIRHTDPQFEKKHRHIHPFVSRDKTPCFGNLEHVVNRLSIQKDFTGLFLMIHQLLTNYDDGAEAYRSIEAMFSNGNDAEDDEAYEDTRVVTEEVEVEVAVDAFNYEQCMSMSRPDSCIACLRPECPVYGSRFERCRLTRDNARINCNTRINCNICAHLTVCDEDRHSRDPINPVAESFDHCIQTASAYACAHCEREHRVNCDNYENRFERCSEDEDSACVECEHEDECTEAIETATEERNEYDQR